MDKMIFYYCCMLFLLIVLWLIIFFSNHPIQIILAFIGIVVQIALNLILINFDFYAYILLIIYIGAVIVLFLFFTMLASIEVFVQNFWFSNIYYFFLLFFVSVNLFFYGTQFIYNFKIQFMQFFFSDFYLNIIEYFSFSYSSVEVLAWIFYTRYFFVLILLSLLLLIALIAPILLTLNINFVSLKKQTIAVQLNQMIIDSINQYNIKV